MKQSILNKLYDEAFAAAEEGTNEGFCLSCGQRHQGVEPDACNYSCNRCGKREVYGAEEILYYTI